MTTRLLLVRHGQSVGNVKQILQGQDNGMLTDLGREQAAEVAQRLKDEPIDAFLGRYAPPRCCASATGATSPASRYRN